MDTCKRYAQRWTEPNDCEEVNGEGGVLDMTPMFLT